MLPAGIGTRMKHVENRFFDRLRRRRFHEHTVRPSFPDRNLCSSVASRAGNDEAHMGQLWLGPDKLEQLEPADRLHTQSEIRSWYDFSRISSSAAAPFGTWSMSVAPSWFSTAVSAAAMELCSPMISVARGPADVMTLIQPRTSRD